MNPVLIFLVFLGVAALWVLGYFLYEPIGRLCSKWYNKTFENTEEQTNKENENE